MILLGSLIVWVFLDVKHEELATDGPEAARARRLTPPHRRTTDDARARSPSR